MALDLHAELRGIVQALDAAGIAYPLVGGLAVSVYAGPRATEDVDILLARDNLARAVERLATLGFRQAGASMSVAGGRLDIPRLIKIEDTDLVPLDLLLPNDAGLATLPTLRPSIEWGEGRLPIVSLEGLRALRGNRVTTRRGFLSGLALAALSAPSRARAQQAAKVPRIGFLSPLSLATDTRLESFLQGLRELGYVDGQTIAIEFRFGDGKPERLPGLAAELVGLKVDVIVATAQASTEAARRATGTIPIVFVVVGDPVAVGLVASLARPGGNVTGLASVAPDVVGKQLELLKEVVPRLSRVAFLQNPNNPGHAVVLRQAEAAARTLGLQLHAVQARTPAEIDAAFAAMRSQRSGGVLVGRDALVLQQRAQIAALAAKSRLPAVYGFRENAEAGGLLAYGANVSAMYRRAASYVDKILKGAKPADLPVEQPTKFELVINLKTAKVLGLTIPQSLLQRADEVIQ